MGDGVSPRAQSHVFSFFLFARTLDPRRRCDVNSKNRNARLTQLGELHTQPRNFANFAS